MSEHEETSCRYLNSKILFSSCVSCVNRKGITQTYKARIYIICQLIFRGLIKKVKKLKKLLFLPQAA